ncbi:MAG: dTDP-4-dehydrorhamnose reductase [Bryobacterales bacterium]|nr:dTDP-4-dehydrorhamnose reductase [Bryobacterales bacterium]
MLKNVVVFGAAGQLGVELVRVLENRGYRVHPFNRASVDITNLPLLEQTLGPLDPSAVVNAAAYNQVDVAEQEPQAAYAANALGVRNLALACRQLDTLLVHFSTDYVFDGKLGRPYVETDVPRPLGAYAVSKLAGELYAQAYLENPLIIRTSGVFGPGGLKTARGNFVELMLRLAKAGKPIRVVEDHVASPTYAPALASRTVDLIETPHRGVFHIGGGEAISWFAYARKIFEVAGLQPELHPTNEREYRTAARRPKYSALANTRLAETGVSPMPPLADALATYLNERSAYLPA